MSHVSYYEGGSERAREGGREVGKERGSEGTREDRELGAGGRRERMCVCVWEEAVPLHKLLQGLGALQLSMGM